ncbi:hypothetical protein BH11BAC4_BH11BAC4_25260 [soil metagenome]
MKFILVTCICLLQIICFAAAINPNLTAEYNTAKRQVELKWQQTDAGITRFILQRSDDNNSWKNIFVLDQDDFSKKKQEKFYDLNPGPDKNYYRLQIFTDAAITYSTSIMVIIGRPLNSWTMYPVPVRDMLNLQYNGSDPINGVVSIFIQNMYGYVLTRKRFSSLNRIIQVPVDNLGRGTYDIRIVINDQIVWNQRFLK